jgi:hypothetical protein
MMKKPLYILLYTAICLSLFIPWLVSCGGASTGNVTPSAAQVEQEKAAEPVLESIVISPSVLEIKKNATATVTVINPSDSTASGTVTVSVNGTNLDPRNVDIEPKGSQKIVFTFTKDIPGSYKVNAGQLAATVFFTEPGGKIIDLFTGINPGLAKELQKLPDLKEIDDKDNAALAKILMLASDKKNNPFFDVILNEGVPDKRAYCAPLEALLWLANDYDYDKLSQNFAYYNMHSLLLDSWRYSTTSDNYTSAKWKKVEDVVDRLSSPRLVSMYMQDNIKYDNAQADTMTTARKSNIFNLQVVFDSKKGVCHEMVIFAQHCLKKSGYKFENISNGDYGACYMGIHTATGAIGHAVCMVREECQYYEVNNGILAGPFPNIETAANTAALSVEMPDWSGFWMYDIDLKTDNRVDETARFVTADSIKGKNIIVDKIIDPWPSNAKVVDAEAGSYTAKTKEGKISDIKTVKALIDDKFLYVSIQMAGELDNTYTVNYYLDLDFNGDSKYEYEFGFFPDGYSWVFDRTMKNSIKAAQAGWWTFITAGKDTVEIRIPVSEYHIPREIKISCASSERGKILDDTGWLEVP